MLIPLRSPCRGGGGKGGGHQTTTSVELASNNLTPQKSLRRIFQQRNETQRRIKYSKMNLFFLPFFTYIIHTAVLLFIFFSYFTEETVWNREQAGNQRGENWSRLETTGHNSDIYMFYVISFFFFFFFAFTFTKKEQPKNGNKFYPIDKFTRLGVKWERMDNVDSVAISEHIKLWDTCWYTAIVQRSGTKTSI